MLKMIKIFAVLIGLLGVSNAFAGGAILYEIGTTDLRLASAGWSARAEDASTVFTNPAGMTRLDCCELLFGLQALYSYIDFDPNSETTVHGSNGDASMWFPGGGTYIVCPLTDRIRLGFASLGYFGSTMDFGDHWVGRYYIEKTTLMGFSAVPAVAYRLSDCISLGVGYQLMYSIFRDQVGINNALDHLSDGLVRVHDYKFGQGFNVGVLYEFSPCTRIGATYVSRVKLDYKAKPHFHDVGPRLNVILDRLGLLDTDIVMTIKVPQWVMVSGYHEINSCWAVMANVGWQEWSKFGRVSIELSSQIVPSLSVALKFKNTWHYALGVQYNWDCDTKVSAGVAYDTSCVSNKNRSLNFPVGEQWRFGTGVQYACGDNLEISAAYELMWSGDLKIDVRRGPLAGTVSGKFRDMATHFFNVSLIWQF